MINPYGFHATTVEAAKLIANNGLKVGGTEVGRRHRVDLSHSPMCPWDIGDKYTNEGSPYKPFVYRVGSNRALVVTNLRAAAARNGNEFWIHAAAAAAAAAVTFTDIPAELIAEIFIRNIDGSVVSMFLNYGSRETEAAYRDTARKHKLTVDERAKFIEKMRNVNTAGAADTDRAASASASGSGAPGPKAKDMPQGILKRKPLVADARGLRALAKANPRASPAVRLTLPKDSLWEDAVQTETIIVCPTVSGFTAARKECNFGVTGIFSGFSRNKLPDLNSIKVSDHALVRRYGRVPCPLIARRPAMPSSTVPTTCRKTLFAAFCQISATP